MKSTRKGVVLPHIIMIMLFIFTLGLVYLAIANANMSLANNNEDRSKSYYLARAGLEMGTAFLYAPFDASISGGNRSWFEMGASSDVSDNISNIRGRLNVKTGGSASEKDVYIKYSMSGATQTIDSLVFTKTGSLPTGSGFEKFGTISVRVEVVNTSTTSSEKSDHVYRIISVGRLEGKSGVNSTYTLTKDIEVTNEYNTVVY